MVVAVVEEEDEDDAAAAAPANTDKINVHTKPAKETKGICKSSGIQLN